MVDRLFGFARTSTVIRLVRGTRGLWAPAAWIRSCCRGRSL